MDITFVLGFAGGVGVSILGAFATAYFERRKDKGETKERLTFELYMKLFELQGWYEPLVWAEFHNEEYNREMKERVWRKTWEIADLLREIDAVDQFKFLEEVLRVLFSDGFPSAKSRKEELNRLIDELGKDVNPRYSRIVSQIHAEDMANLATKNVGVVDFNSDSWKTPGSSI